MRTIGLVAVAVFLLPLCACTLNFRLVNASYRKPSNVAVYFSVTYDENEPVPGLTPEQFKLYEDDKLVSQFESKQILVNPDLAAIQYTLLLMDMSGSVTESGGLDDLITAAGNFADRVGKTQPVAIYAFDGRKEIHPIAAFSSSGGTVGGGIQSLRSFKSKDPSTNLNGAMMEGLRVLKRQMDHATQSLRFGTLVVFTDGSDRAHRVSHDDVMQALDGLGPTMNVFVIGVGTEIDESELKALGRSGSALSKKPAELSLRFDQIAQKIEGLTHSFYLFSYCSPARAGEHDLRIETTVRTGTGSARWFSRSGSLNYHFDSNGFGPNCDPHQLPPFEVKSPRLKGHLDS
jgi:hypothetical protein